MEILDSIADKAKQVTETISESPVESALIAGAVVATGVAVVASRGRAISLLKGMRGTASHLPEMEITAAKTLTGDSLTAMTKSGLPQQTLAEMATEKVAKMSFATAKRVLTRMGKFGEAGEPLQVDDQLRRHVFNRFLSRLDQERWVLHGSYGLESRQYIARKAVKDLDLLSLDRGLVKSTRQATDDALVQNLRTMVGKPGADGLTFEIPQLAKEGLQTRLFYPRMRHGVAIAKTTEGQEIMRIPLDIRVGAQTILPSSKVTLRGSAELGKEGEVVFNTMAAEENFAYKLFTYTNRTLGGVARKPKDLRDMANMVESGGLDQAKVNQALSAWTRQGYSLGAMRHPREILGNTMLEQNMHGQTALQLDRNFGIVRKYYEGLVPQLDTSVSPGVGTGAFSRLSRFFKKQFEIYPVG